MEMAKDRGLIRFQGQAGTFSELVNAIPYTLTKYVTDNSRDDSYDYTGKKVAVIGNGSSGIQCVPAMQPKVEKLVNFVRNPTWISVNICADKALDGRNFSYTEEDKKRFREDPKAHLALRKELEAR
jgi:NADPH-dependent glutamate synthase beta subunit-like oxidoreductase